MCNEPINPKTVMKAIVGLCVAISAVEITLAICAFEGVGASFQHATESDRAIFAGEYLLGSLLMLGIARYAYCQFENLSVLRDASPNQNTLTINNDSVRNPINNIQMV